jgi:hypothetical protein
LNYRFHGGEDVQAPMPGTVISNQELEGGWTSVALAHEGGLKSELTFPGKAAALDVGARVETGQKLGVLDPAKPALAWNLDWS